jgi:hypothetical protein
MTPPVEDLPEGGSLPRTDLPIAQWNQEQTFDTVAACEAHKKNIGILIQRGAKAPEVQSAVNRLVVNRVHGRCVPAEAIYPPATK